MSNDDLKSKLEASFAGCPDADIRREIAEMVFFAFPEMTLDRTLLFPGNEENERTRKEFEGRGRYDFVEDWLDPYYLWKISAYARWYFTPSFLLKTLTNPMRNYDAHALPYYILFSEGELGQLDILDECFINVIEGYDIELLNVPKMIQSLSFKDLYLATQKSVKLMGIGDFAISAAFFSPMEKKVISRLLGWLESYYPDEPIIFLAKKHFWDI
ncbi:MAG: hypothetical protein Q8O38_16255 [Sulfurimicrobium sp.]|nr:hypothetical protein [Sulfurimicrobium sp.]